MRIGLYQSLSLPPPCLQPLLPSVKFSCTPCGQVTCFTAVIFVSLRILLSLSGTLQGKREGKISHVLTSKGRLGSCTEFP
jgi:hypothetical protein